MKIIKTIEFRIVETQNEKDKSIFIPEKRISHGLAQPADIEPHWENLNAPCDYCDYSRYYEALLAIDAYIQINRPQSKVIHELPEFTLKITTNE
jgi:hypothetical protein